MLRPEISFIAQVFVRMGKWFSNGIVYRIYLAFYFDAFKARHHESYFDVVIISQLFAIVFITICLLFVIVKLLLVKWDHLQ